MKNNFLKLFICVLFISGIGNYNCHGQTMGWGRNGEGQLGIGNTTQPNNPVTVTSMSDASGIGGGLFHALILKPDGTVMVTGFNGNGQLGDGTITQRISPVTLSGLTNVRSVSGGGFHSTALRSDGTVWSWGNNFYGQMGNGTSGADQLTPTQTTISDVVQVEAGYWLTEQFLIPTNEKEFVQRLHHSQNSSWQKV